MMHRTPLAVGVLGLVLAAGAVHAAESPAPASVTLFGQKYSVIKHSLQGTYKNAVKIQQVENWADQVNSRKNKVDFVQGATPDKDRLFVANAPQPSDDKADFFYTLTGSDPNTCDFNTQVSSAEQHFGGAVDAATGGRITDLLWLNDTDTGKKTDKNIVAVTFSDDDHYRFYDQDTLNSGYLTDQLAFAENHVIRGIGSITLEGAHVGEDALDVADPNSPFSGFFTFAKTSNPQYLIAMAHPNADAAFGAKGAEIGIMDLNTTNFLPVLTDVTASLPTHDDGSGTETVGFIHGLEPATVDANMAPTSNVYWALWSDPEPGGATVTPITNELVQLQIDLPADPTKAKSGDIKVKTLAKEDLMKTGLADLTDNATNFIFGMSLGREVNGKRCLYLTDWNGNLFTLTPQ